MHRQPASTITVAHSMISSGLMPRKMAISGLWEKKASMSGVFMRLLVLAAWHGGEIGRQLFRRKVRVVEQLQIRADMRLMHADFGMRLNDAPRAMRCRGRAVILQAFRDLGVIDL